MSTIYTGEGFRDQDTIEQRTETQLSTLQNNALIALQQKNVQAAIQQLDEACEILEIENENPELLEFHRVNIANLVQVGAKAVENVMYNLKIIRDKPWIH